MYFRSNTSILVFAVALALQGCVSAPPSPTATQAPAAQSPAKASDTRQRLDALFENYFEDNLRANPLLATYIGDHRYDGCGWAARDGGEDVRTPFRRHAMLTLSLR